MSSKSILVYSTLYVLANLFHISSLSAVEDLEIKGGKSHKKVFANKARSSHSAMEQPSLSSKSSKIKPPKTIVSTLGLHPIFDNIEHPPRKQNLTIPVELCTADLNTLFQRRCAEVQGLLATIIKEENISILEISEKSKISAVFCPEVSRSKVNQNPLGERRKNDSRTGKYALYHEEDLIEGACLEICFAWPKTCFKE